MAIQHYKEAFNYTEIPAKINLAGFDSNYYITLETIQKIWGWLGLAYREIGSEKETIKCFEKEAYFAHLAQVYVTCHQTRKKELYKEFIVIIVIELFLLIAGSITYVFLSAYPVLVNFIYFLIDFTIFLIFLVNFRYNYKRHLKKERFLEINGLSNYAKRRDRDSPEIFTDPVYINLVSLGFLMVLVSFIFLWAFVNNISGQSYGWMDSLINAISFHPAYITITFIGLFFDRLFFFFYEMIVQTYK